MSELVHTALSAAMPGAGGARAQQPLQQADSNVLTGLVAWACDVVRSCMRALREGEAWWEGFSVCTRPLGVRMPRMQGRRLGKDALCNAPLALPHLRSHRAFTGWQASRRCAHWGLHACRSQAVRDCRSWAAQSYLWPGRSSCSPGPAGSGARQLGAALPACLIRICSHLGFSSCEALPEELDVHQCQRHAVRVRQSVNTLNFAG